MSTATLSKKSPETAPETPGPTLVVLAVEVPAEHIELVEDILNVMAEGLEVDYSRGFHGPYTVTDPRDVRLIESLSTWYQDGDNQDADDRDVIEAVRALVAERQAAEAAR